MPIRTPHAGNRVLLTGATGFIGANLWPLLIEDGYEVRCMSRNPDDARERFPDREWVYGDLDDPDSLSECLEGCSAAVYLVHRMEADPDDFRSKERADAEAFLNAAEQAGLERIVYLGGMQPEGEPSEHLSSRLEVGEILRKGRVSTIEVRASMIVGYGSASWFIVRDLAARAPGMVLPTWAESKTQPIAMSDILEVLRSAVRLDEPGSGYWNVPGPDTLSIREMIEQTAEVMGRRTPVILELPDLLPELTVKGLGAITRTSPSLASELALGMMQDVCASDRLYWERTEHAPRRSFIEAAREAISEEPDADERDPWTHVERWVRRLS